MFWCKYPSALVPASSTISKLVMITVHSTGSFFDYKQSRQTTILTDIMPDKTETRLEHSPHKPLTLLGQKAQVLKITA